MGGAHSQRKGKAYEREVARRLREVFADARRGIGQAREAGEVPDVEVPYFWPEAKHRKRVNFPAALAQAQEAARGRGVPLAVGRVDRQPDVVAMYLDDFLTLLAEWWANRTQDRNSPQQGGAEDGERDAGRVFPPQA